MITIVTKQDKLPEYMAICTSCGDISGWYYDKTYPLDIARRHTSVANIHHRRLI